MVQGALECPTLEMSREDFRRPFSTFVSDFFRHNPDVAMFKVKPPKGWSPRFEQPTEEEIDELEIQTPIVQHAFGTRGTYRCLLIEQKPMKVRDFKAKAAEEGHQPPKKGHEDDDVLERSFWSHITLNPPLYGADTPMSLFDKKLRFGWNLRDLGDMLQKPGLSQIPGVTSPMVYFGMWKSFFCWHTEDCDLYSINYMHFGAPKVWYCVAPSDRAKFEAMARKEFPELYKNCKGFMRHKDLMFSPSMLRMHNVPFMQVKQEAGDFVVLNAAAYHGGFNMGFNCAEAVNFALPQWIPTGIKALPCKCPALRDAVRIDMRFFCPNLPESESEAESEILSSSDDSDEENEQEVAHPKKRGRPPKSTTPAKRGRPRKNAEAGAVPAKRGRPRKNPESTAKRGRPRKDTAEVAKRGRGRPTKEEAAKKKVGRPQKTPAGEGAEAKGKMGRPRKDAEGPTRRPGRPRKHLAADAGISKRGPGRPRKHPPPAPAASAAAKPTPARPRPTPASVAKAPAMPSFLAAAIAKQQAAKPVKPVAPVGRLTATSARASGKRSLRSTVSVLPELSREAERALDAGGRPMRGARKSPQQLVAIVGKSPRQDKYFYLCQQLPVESASDKLKGFKKGVKDGEVNLLWLKEEADGLFRPSNEVWQEREESLVKVRSQLIKGDKGLVDGYKLLTMRSRILNTQLVD